MCIGICSAEAAIITAGLIDYLYLGVKLGIYPCLIFIGVGAMTDFGPLIANPKSLLLGAAAQLGIFIDLLQSARLLGFSRIRSASSIGIIGGADGPTAIFVTSTACSRISRTRSPSRLTPTWLSMPDNSASDNAACSPPRPSARL